MIIYIYIYIYITNKGWYAIQPNNHNQMRMQTVSAVIWNQPANSIFHSDNYYVTCTFF